MEHASQNQYWKALVRADEQVLWTGKPDSGNIFAGVDRNKLSAGLLFAGVGSLFAFPPLFLDGDIAFTLFGMFFVIIGLYLSLGKALRNLFLRKDTLYVITNKKIIRFRGQHIDMLKAEEMPPPDVIFHRNGNATLVFGSSITDEYTLGGDTHTEFGPDPFTLENLPDVSDAEAAIAKMDR